jgi:hypothetical protein
MGQLWLVAGVLLASLVAAAWFSISTSSLFGPRPLNGGLQAAGDDRRGTVACGHYSLGSIPNTAGAICALMSGNG